MAPASPWPALTRKLIVLEMWGAPLARNTGMAPHVTRAAIVDVPYTMSPDTTASGHHRGEGRCPSGNSSSTKVASVPSAGIHAHRPNQTITRAPGNHEPVRTKRSKYASVG